MKVKSESEVAQSCPTLATPWTAAHQAPPSVDFPGESTGVGAIAFSAGLHYLASKAFPSSNLCLDETEAGVCSPLSVKRVGWIRMVSRFLPALTVHGFRVSIKV